MSNLYHKTLQNTDFTIFPEKPIGKPDPIQSLTELNIDLKLGDLNRDTKHGKCELTNSFVCFISGESLWIAKNM